MFTQLLITVISVISELHAGDLAMDKTDTALPSGAYSLVGNWAVNKHDMQHLGRTSDLTCSKQP